MPQDLQKKSWTITRAQGQKIAAHVPISFDLTVASSEDEVLVILSQIPGHVGISVTNAIETIIASVSKTLPANVTKTWFEHYPAGASIAGHRYTLMRVSFPQGQPEWSNLYTWEQIADHFGIPVTELATGYDDELA